MPDQVRALVISPDDDTEPTAVSIDSGYLTYQHILGGTIEAVYGSSPDGERAVFYVNDEGIRENLPLNALATRLWRRLNPAAGRSVLLGTVIVVGANGPDDDDIPESVVEVARRVYSEFGEATLTAIRAQRRRT
jgi:hypothetical protein